jgi:hypothetical protein
MAAELAGVRIVLSANDEQKNTENQISVFERSRLGTENVQKELSSAPQSK